MEPASIESLPPELIEAILYDAAAPNGSGAQDDRTGSSTLSQLALVNSTWSAIARRLLYSALTFDWRVTTAARLTRSLDNDPALAPVVRSLDLVYSSAHSWITAWILAHKHTWTVADERWEWAHRPPSVDSEDVQNVDEAWGSWSLFENRKTQWATEAMLASGDEPWLTGGQERRDGASALFRLLGRLPRLERLTLEGFTGDEIDSVLPSLSTHAAFRRLTALRFSSIDWRALASVLSMINGAPNLSELDLDSVQHFPIQSPFAMQLNFPRLSHVRAGFGSTISRTANLIKDLLVVAKHTLTSVSLGPHFESAGSVVSIALSLPHLRSFTYHYATPPTGPTSDRDTTIEVLAHSLPQTHITFLEIRGIWPSSWPLPASYYTRRLTALPDTLEVYVESFSGPLEDLQGFLEHLLENTARLENLKGIRVALLGRVTVEVDAIVAAVSGASRLVELVPGGAY